MDVLCMQCSQGFRQVQMELEYEGLRYSIYRCQTCGRSKKIRRKILGLAEIEDVSYDEANAVVTRGNIKSGLLLLGLAALAVFLDQ